jgi:hypothetical protein
LLSTAGDVPTFPPARYGWRRDPARLRRRRWIAYLLAGLTVLASVAVAIKLYRQYRQVPYEVTNVVASPPSDTSIEVTFEVRTPGGVPATCTVVAHARFGERVGLAQVQVPPGEPTRTIARVRYTLATTGRPVTAEVTGCGPARNPGTT